MVSSLMFSIYVLKTFSIINHLILIFVLIPIDALPSPKLGPRWALVSKTMKLWGLEGTLPALSTKKGRGVC